MKNSLSTKLVYLDLKTIMENYRKPEFWEKDWLIFKSKELEITWSITSIDILSNVIQSRIRFRDGHITRGGKKFWFPSSFTSRRDNWYCYETICRPIPIENSDYTQGAFDRNILYTILDSIRYLEKEFASYTYEYKKARELEDEQCERLKDIAEEFLDREGVSNESIRDAYIEKYVDDNKENYTNKVLENSQFRFFKTAYLHVCSWFGNDKAFEEYKALLKKYIPKKQIFKILKKTKEMQSDEWVEEMKDQLEDI